MQRFIESFLKPVMTAGPDAALATVARTMEQHNVGAVVIVENLKPVGIVTDRDLALALAVRGASPHTPAAKVMTTPIEIIGTDGTVFEATQLLRERKVRRLAVVDEDGCLVGIVTCDDLLRLLSRELANLIEGIEAEMLVK